MKREELIAYDKWLTRRKWGTGEIISPEKAADLYLAEHPLPPAEGAETILRQPKYNSLKNLTLICEAMEEFAASRNKPLQPTAERAEEIKPTAYEWHNLKTGHCYVDYVPHLDAKEGYTKIPLYSAFHAQRLADKMVSERLREEKCYYCNGDGQVVHDYEHGEISKCTICNGTGRIRK